jgi:hypothetical protein
MSLTALFNQLFLMKLALATIQNFMLKIFSNGDLLTRDVYLLFNGSSEC